MSNSKLFSAKLYKSSTVYHDDHVYHDHYVYVISKLFPARINER